MLTPEQFEARKNGIGASEAAAVLNRSPYYTAYQLWLIKTGRITPEPILTEEKLRLRHAHEITVANEYAYRHNLELITPAGTTYHPKYPFMLCHLDRIAIGQKRGLECKSSSAFLAKHFGEHGSDDVRFDYIIQVQHQYACSGLERIDLAALIDADDYREYIIPRDENIIQHIEEACDHFWNYHVLKDIPPDPNNRIDLDLIYPRCREAYVEADNAIMDAYYKLHEIKAQKKVLEAEEKDLEYQLIKYIGDHEGLARGNKIIATYKLNHHDTRTFRLRSL